MKLMSIKERYSMDNEVTESLETMNYNISVCSFAVADKILDRSHVMGEGFVLAHGSRAHSSPSQTKEV